MTIIVMFMLLTVVGLIQSLFPPLMILSQARPPLLAAAVVFYAVYFPTPVMLAAAVFGGILYDANSLLPLGATTLYYCIAGVLIQKHASFWREAGGLSLALLTTLTAVGQPLVLWFAGMTVWERADGVPGGWLRHLLAVALMGMPAGLVTLRVAGRLHRMTGTLEEVINP